MKKKRIIWAVVMGLASSLSLHAQIGGGPKAVKWQEAYAKDSNDFKLLTFTAAEFHGTVYIRCAMEPGPEEGLLMLERSSDTLIFHVMQLKQCYNSDIPLNYSFQEQAPVQNTYWYRIHYVRQGKTAILSDPLRFEGQEQVASTE